MRAPVAAEGCPSAIEPPRTLKRSMSTSPIASLRPSSDCAKAFDPSILTLHNTCAAKASCMSMMAKSLSFAPAASSATGAAYAGPMSIHPFGSTAAYAQERK